MASALRNETILVADDDPLIVTTIAHVLRSDQFGVTSAFDSAAALDVCVREKPALAIIDYSMPGMNGVELARQIAEQTAVPVMFLSAYNDEAIVAEAVAAGAMAYLVKPVDTLQILPAVHTALQRSRELHALRFQAEQLNSALRTGRNISIATGLLMARFQITQQEAFERLRRRARSQSTRLDSFAGELLKATEEAGKLYESLGEHLPPPPGHREDA